jgi:PPOX class probable F420-dependent enzyme
MTVHIQQFRKATFMPIIRTIEETSMATIPESHRDILDKRSFAHVATIDNNGAPQVTPVWIDHDGNYILINSQRGRKKDRNLRARSSVGISVTDPDDPYRYLGIQGRVVEISEEGAEAHIHKLSRKYKGQDYQNLKPGDVRVIYKIEPTRVWTMG